MGTDVKATPTVSVVMPTYNAAAFLAQAVQSVLGQTFSDFELIVLDDGSTDATVEVMDSFKDPRIHYVRHKKNRGLVAMLNEGLELARGRFIARFDADDVMRDDRLERQVRFLDSYPGITVVAAFVDLIDTDGEASGIWATDRETTTEVEIRRMMPRTNCIAHPTVMMRANIAKDLCYEGRYQDWDLWLRMLARGHRIAKITEPMVKYRVHPGSDMGSAKKQLPLEVRLMRSRWEFLRHEWARLRISSIQFAVLVAQGRTLARHILNTLHPIARDVYRTFTYSPLRLLAERRALRKVEAGWKGQHIFLFPYLSTGGAERVHADIMGAVEGAKPLLVICGFSTDRSFETEYATLAFLIELPRLLHHPFTRRRAHARLAELINAQERPILFSSNTAVFFDLMPALRKAVRTFHLQHAFLHQPDGNVQHKAWLQHLERVDGYVFISGQAHKDFQRFLKANGAGPSAFTKLHLIPNAVHGFGSVEAHERTGLLFVGRPSPEKRLDLFLQLAKTLDTIHPSKFRFTVVGADDPGGHACVAFRGSITDAAALRAIYREHDIVVLTSEREGFPMVIMEAMAQGLAVISTPVGDVPERLKTDVAVVTGSIEPARVLDEMAHAIVRLDTEREILQRMKVAALEQAKKEFDLERFLENYRDLFNSPASSA